MFDLSKSKHTIRPEALGGRMAASILLMVVSLITVGCNPKSLDGLLGSGTKAKDSLSTTVASANDIVFLSIKSGDTHRFLTSNKDYRPDKDCVDQDFGAQYDRQKSLYDGRTKQIDKLADYVASLKKALEGDAGAAWSAIDTTLDIVSAVTAKDLSGIGLNIPSAVGLGANALKAARKAAKDNLAVEAAFELIRKNDQMIRELVVSLSKTIISASREATAAQQAWEACEADSLNFMKSRLSDEASTTVALVNLEARHKNFLDQRYDLRQKIQSISDFATERDKDDVLIPLAKLREVHAKLAKEGPTIDPKLAASQLQDVYDALSKLYASLTKQG